VPDVGDGLVGVDVLDAPLDVVPGVVWSKSVFVVG
jgi:hypothetical protein